MENISIENGVCKSETPTGAEHIRSCFESDVSSADHLLVMVHGIVGRVFSADHLVVMVHGIVGSASDWHFGAEKFVKRFPDKVFVHCSARNEFMLTLDGVDVMGERLAAEVVEISERKPNLRKISFVAHSAGGIVTRYTIAKLFRPYKSSSPESGKDTSVGTIAGLEPVNFITVATPHLGSRGNNQVPMFFGLAALEKLASSLVYWVFGKTGMNLFLTDNNDGRPPLLKRMVEDYGELPFMSALRSFKRRVAYANIGYDHIVGWGTSSIRRNSELPEWDADDPVNEKYPHVVYEEYCEACDTDEKVSDRKEDDGSDKLEEELVTGLSRVSWEKVDVSFHSSRSRFAAHSVIQVKDPYMHSEGADVIEHMIDRFLL